MKYSTICILLSALYYAQGLSLVSRSTSSRAKFVTSTSTNVNGFRPISSSTQRSNSATKLCSSAAAIATDAGDDNLDIKYGPGKFY